MSTPFGSGVSEWAVQALGHAQRIDDSMRDIVYNNFDTDSLGSIEVGISGTVTYDVPLSAGIANLQSGVLQNGYGLVYNAGGSILVASGTGVPWYAHARCRPRTSVTSTAGWHAVGLQSEAGEFVALGAIASVNPDMLTLRIGGSGGTTDIVTDVVVDLDAFHRYAICLDPLNATVLAFVDEIQVAEQTDLSNLTADPLFMYCYVFNGASVAANNQLWVDNLAVALVPN